MCDSVRAQAATSAPALSAGGPEAAEGRPASRCPWRNSPGGNQAKPGQLEQERGGLCRPRISETGTGKDDEAKEGSAKTRNKPTTQARDYLKRKDQEAVQAGKLGVDLSIQTANLRNQTRLEQTAVKNVSGRNCLEIGGVWIDEGFDAKNEDADDQGPERRLLQAAGPAVRKSKTC